MKKNNNLILRECIICDKQLKKQQIKFCSQKCASKKIRTKDKIQKLSIQSIKRTTCIECYKKLSGKQVLYCSKACGKRYVRRCKKEGRITEFKQFLNKYKNDISMKECLNCNEIFVRKKTDRNWRWKRRKFCSQECSGLYNKNKKHSIDDFYPKEESKRIFQNMIKQRCVTCKKKLSGKQEKYCSAHCKSSNYYKKNKTSLNNNSSKKQKEKGLRRKKALIELMGGGCNKCGYNRFTAGLCFHHINPKDKEFPLSIRILANYKWERILDEASKCALLCHTCHMEEHYDE